VCDAEISDDAAHPDELAEAEFNQAECPNCSAELRRRHSVADRADRWEVRL
jgi:hypothetical protein